MASPSSPLLRLPAPLRHKIYTLAGLVRPCPIVLPGTDHAFHQALDRDPEEACRHRLMLQGRFESGSDSEPECVCEPLPWSLLLVCKSISTEAHGLLYGHNQFVLRCHDAADLASLRAWGNHALAALTRLLVRLNCWPCAHGHDPRFGSRCATCFSDTSKGDPPLDQATPAGQELLLEWRRFGARLAAHVPEGQLALTFICDASDAATAQAVAEPLRQLPRLAECNLRLGRTRDALLLDMARQLSASKVSRVGRVGTRVSEVGTSASKVGIHQASSTVAVGFPFQRLPQEVRLAILGLSDLGPRGSYPPGLQTIRIHDNKLWNASDFRSRDLCCDHCTFIDYCCCPVYYAAHSATCRCRVLPMELFRVSRQMQDDAFDVLFAGNEFAFHQPPRRSLAFFQSSLPSGALPHLRRLVFWFNDVDLQDWEPEVQGKQWEELIRFIAGHLRTANLSFTLDTRMDWVLEAEAEGPEGLERLYASYCSLLQPLRLLRTASPEGKLLDLHLKLGSFTKLAPVVERYVMGRDYDSLQGNRDAKTPRDASWAAPSDLPRWIVKGLGETFPAWTDGG